MTRLPEQDLLQVARATGALWEPLRGGSILVTGATGFFGRWLLESLGAINRELGLGLRVIAQSRDPAAYARRVPHLGAGSGIRWVEARPGDLSEDLVRAATGVRGLDAVVHLVTEADNTAMMARPDLAEETIVGTTRAALALAREAGARHFLLTSSGAVYDPHRAGPSLRLGEDFPVVEFPTGQPSGHLVGGVCKRQAEELCVNEAQVSGLCTTIARCFTFVGPGMPLRGKFALGNFIDDALQHRDLVVQGDGLAVRSYLYAADLAVWLWTILLRGGPGRAYNVGSEKAVSIRETAETVRAVLAPTRAVKVLGAVGAGAGAYYVPDTGRARADLQLQETVALPEAIRRTAAWAGHSALT